jgi:aspartokinase
MKWQAKRISELVSGFGELWSAKILATLLQRRSSVDRNENYVYIDARRIITIDEEAIQDGAVVWDTSKSKLEITHREEMKEINKGKVHLVCTGYVRLLTLF